MTPLSSGRPKGLLHWFVLLLLFVVAGVGYWYYQQRQSLICAAEGGGSWTMTYSDGENVSKFMWAIRPQNETAFVDCLKDKGYDVKTIPKSGEITAFDSFGRTISNSIGDDFVQKGIFYKW